MDKKSKIILISGPTASGKSNFAIKIAKKINGEIINADSMQVYKKFKILTARPETQNQKKIKHHLYGVIDLNKKFSTGHWLRLVKKKHPFEGDLNHLHHIVLKKTKNNNLTIMITITLSIIPTLLLFLKIKTFLILLLVLTIYVSLILYCRPR